MTICAAGSREYTDEHAEDDPDATHVQIRQLSAFSWLTGGKIVDRTLFLLVVLCRFRVACAGRAAAGQRATIDVVGRDALEGAEPLPARSTGRR